MSDNCPRHVLFRALTELRANSRMPNEPVAALANEEARECGAVANVKLHIFERRRALRNKKEIGPVKNANVARADAVSDGRSQDRVFNRWKASKVIPQIFAGRRSLIRCRSLIG